MVHQEHVALLRDVLARYREGLFFFYFSEVDQKSHILWGRHEPELRSNYRELDETIGTVVGSVQGADILVMCDHGFAAFDTAVNLNTWLKRDGFLQTGKGGLDWTRTKAYAMGLNALYVNLAGREQHGIVHDGAQRNSLIAELKGRLEAEKPSIEKVSVLPRTTNRFEPDLIVGYAPGYGASWETALGETPADVFAANDDAWIGDHCVAALAVPGILVFTKKLKSEDARLKVLPVTILNYFGLPPDRAMKGRSLF